jgi:hypothetical protein
VGDDKAVREENSSVAGWDERELYAQKVRNYTDKPIELEVRRTYPGDILFRSQLEPKLHDYQTPEFLARVAAGERADLLFEIVRHQGYAAKQNHVVLETAEVK